jgi:hypothetical protein
MADVKISMEMVDEGNSVQKKTGDVKELSGELTKVQKLAKNTFAGLSPSGKMTSQSIAKAVSGQEVEGYNRARGAAGAAGGTARDFADQSRGLGGLVRIYATVAANVFAAAAAFGALSRAMDTTNMVQGLDQLGAASGTALGSLSKRVAIATDGAVSLREAMEATVKASSAGLDSSQILKMGDVAKKASQALGVNMTDALSRLSRGISKLEPELLDELGIFVKIDDATSKYALSVGKSTSALTDFERRQAFANAVLEQGAKKFGDIKIDSNPYSKLAASFQNLVQSGLELVNKVFAPIAKILADNSGLLAVAFGLVAFKILKMAVPALGQWRQQLVETANTAKEKAQAINTAFGEAWVGRWETRLKLPELRAGVKAVQKELRGEGFGFGKDATQNVIDGFKSVLRGEELSKTQIQATKLAITDKNKQIQKLGDVQDKNSKRQAVQLQGEIAQLEKILALNQKILALNIAETTIETKSGKQPGFFSGDAQRDRRAKGASTTAIALAELAAIPGETMEKGFMDSMKNMKANLDKQGVGFIKKWSTMAVGALAGATTAIGLFAASIQMWVAAFAIIGTAIYGVIKYFSATKKESDLTSEALTRLEDASKSAALTLERLRTVSPLENMTVENIQARANALKELGDVGTLSVMRAFDEISKMNVGDQFLNWVSGLWGGDVQTKMSEGLADSIKNAFKLAENTKLTDESKRAIESLLGTSVNSANLADIIKKVADSGDQTKLKEIVKIIDNMGAAASSTAAKGTELKESIKKISTNIQEFNKSVMPTDILSKMAQDSTVAAQKLGLALNDPVQALTAMKNVVDSTDMLSIFPPDVASNLLSYTSELNNIILATSKAKSETQQYDKEIANLSNEITRLKKNSAGTNTQYLIAEYQRQVEEIEGKKLKIQADLDVDTGNLKKAFDDATKSSLLKSAEMMGARIAAEVTKAQTTVISTIAGLLGDTKVGIQLRAQMERRVIDSQAEVVRQTFELAVQVEALKLQMEKQNLQEERKSKLSRNEKFIDIKGIALIDERLVQITKEESIIQSKGKGQSSVQMARQQKASDASGITQGMIALQQKFEGQSAQLRCAAAQRRSSQIKEEYDLLLNSQKLDREKIQAEERLAVIASERSALQSSNLGLSELDVIAQTNLLNIKKTQSDYDQKRNQINQEYTALSAAGSFLFKEGLVAQANQVEAFAKQERLRKLGLIDAERGLEIDKNSAQIQKQKLEYWDKQSQVQRDSLKTLREIALETSQNTESTQLELLQLDLEYRKSGLIVLNDEIIKEENKLKLLELQLKARQSIDRLNSDLASKKSALEDELFRPGTSVAREAAILAELNALEKLNGVQLSGITRITEAKKQQLDFDAQYSVRQKEFSKIFENTFDKMADAIVQFAQTGKLNFKDLINSMLADLLRYELRLQMMAMYQSMRPGLMNLIPSLFGASGFSGSSIGFGIPSGAAMAMGGAFDDGVRKYAKGGMFTNSIVSQPTLFRFAKGTGLMGEAGPEAIMPLKRDGQGNLGVRGGGGSVEVVVNNYSSEKAEARETTDSRGNRRIEVVVGDMTAGEVTRGGSSTNRAITNTFGMKPQLIRR